MYANKQKWLDNSQCTKKPSLNSMTDREERYQNKLNFKQSLDKLDNITKLNHIMTDREERYQNKLNFKQSLDKLDNITKLNHIMTDREERYQNKLNFKQSLDKLRTIDEHKVLELDNQPIEKEPSQSWCVIV